MGYNKRSIKKKKKKKIPDLLQIEGREKNDKLAIANRFNHFFTNIRPKLASKISSDSNCSYKSVLKNKTSEVFSFSKVDFKPTVLKIINDFQANSSRGFDGICMNY